MGILSNLLRSYGQDEKTSDSATKPPQASTPAVGNQSTNTVATSTPDSSAPLSQPLPVTTVSPAGIDRSNPRHRIVRQLSLYFAGCTFFTLSVLVTRRAVARRMALAKLQHFTPSNYRPKLKDTNGAVEAAEAFGLATINVASFAMVFTGGTMFALDIVDMDDLRDKFRRRMGFDQSDNSDVSADQEVEEWVKSFLDNKDGGDSKSITESLTALVGALASKEEEKLKKESDEDAKSE